MNNMNKLNCCLRSPEPIAKRKCRRLMILTAMPLADAVFSNAGGSKRNGRGGYSGQEGDFT